MNTMEELIKRAGILIDALPYMQKFAGSKVVIKYGGNAMINEELKNSVMEDITLLKYIGLKPIVVHGGGPDISSALKEKGVESRKRSQIHRCRNNEHCPAGAYRKNQQRGSFAS